MSLEIRMRTSVKPEGYEEGPRCWTHNIRQLLGLQEAMNLLKGSPDYVGVSEVSDVMLRVFGALHTLSLQASQQGS